MPILGNQHVNTEIGMHRTQLLHKGGILSEAQRTLEVNFWVHCIEHLDDVGRRPTGGCDCAVQVECTVPLIESAHDIKLPLCHGSVQTRLKVEPRIALAGKQRRVDRFRILQEVLEWAVGVDSTKELSDLQRDVLMVEKVVRIEARLTLQQRTHDADRTRGPCRTRLGQIRGARPNKKRTTSTWSRRDASKTAPCKGASGADANAVTTSRLPQSAATRRAKRRVPLRVSCRDEPVSDFNAA